MNKNMIALILVCFVAYPVLRAAQAAANPPDELRTFSGPWGRIEAGFVPDATHIVLGEPLFVDFVVRNTGNRPLVFRFGGDDRGSVRHNRFIIVARIADEDSAPLRDPHDYRHGGGLVTVERLDPGETYRQPLLLQHWVSFAGSLDPLLVGTFIDKDGRPYEKQSSRWSLSVTAAWRPPNACYRC